MKKSIVFSLATIILALSFISAANAQEDFILRYKANQDKSIIYKMVMDGVTTLYVGEETQVTKVENEMFLNQKVSDFDEESGIISYSTRIASGEMKINGVPSVMPMMGQTLATEMKVTGEFINARNTQTEQLNGAQLVFPETPVKIGHTWNHIMPPNSQMPVPVIIEFKILGTEPFKERTCYKIGMTMKTDESKQIKDMEMNLSAKGIILFDPDEGILVSNHVNSNLRMVIERVIGGKNTTITTRMEMKVRMDLQI